MALLEEKRRFPRLNNRILIHYQLIEKKEADMGDIIKGFTKNISAGGLMFETDKPIPMQSVLNLEVYQPLTQSGEQIISIFTLAKVKHAMRIDDADRYEGSNKYRIGMEFVEIDDIEKKIIANYVKAGLNI